MGAGAAGSPMEDAKAGSTHGAEGQISPLRCPQRGLRGSHRVTAPWPTGWAEHGQPGRRAAPRHDAPAALVTAALWADVYTFVG